VRSLRCSAARPLGRLRRGRSKVRACGVSVCLCHEFGRARVADQHRGIPARIERSRLLDEFTHECLAIRVARRLKAIDVIDLLSDLFVLRGILGHIRSDNGPEFVQQWIKSVGNTYVERGSPWENPLRDELLDGEIFYSLHEAQIVIES